jgi:hypothetical protein
MKEFAVTVGEKGTPGAFASRVRGSELFELVR